MSRLLLFIPAYNCAPQIGRVLDQITPELRDAFAEILVVDNGSSDGTRDVVAARMAEFTAPKLTLARNDANYGLGGSHKVAFLHCLDQGYDGVVVFHGDDQGHLADLMRQLPQQARRDCVLGARFMPGSRITGYSPLRIWANRAFNLLFSAVSGRRLYDLGSGLNFYSRRFLEDRWWLRCGDDLTFNYYMILMSAARRADFAFVPISWREEDQISNAKLFRQGIKMLRMLAAFILQRDTWMSADHASRGGRYTWSPS